jgi:hypothetical protein
MLAEMEFSLDEHPSERELKLQVVRIYNHKLAERNRRKQFAIERGLVDFKHQQQVCPCVQLWSSPCSLMSAVAHTFQLDKRRTKEERDLVGKLRVFARFQSREEHEALVEGMLRAGRLRQQIELYRTYRAMGVRTLEQARQFEAAKRVREKDLKARKHKDSAPYLFQPQAGAGAGAADGPDGGGEEPMEGAKGRRRAGRDSSASLSGQAEEAAGRDGSSSSSGAGGLAGRKRAAPGGQDEWAFPPYASRGSSGTAGAGGAGLASPGRGSGAAAGQATSAAEEAEVVATLTRAPGGDLLSDMELRFCAQVPMLPLHYLAAKDAIVRCVRGVWGCFATGHQMD